MTCSVNDCGRPTIARGYCQNHYRVFMRRGTPIPPARTHKTFRATGGYLFEMKGGTTRYLHVQIAERALGKPLPTMAEIHHVDGDPSNNDPLNLVVCPDHKYHSLLHQRLAAFDATGFYHFRKCHICCTYGDPAQMRQHSHERVAHPPCVANYSRAARQRQKETLHGL
jgi:hypothetical protein